MADRKREAKVSEDPIAKRVKDAESVGTDSGMTTEVPEEANGKKGHSDCGKQRLPRVGEVERSSVIMVSCNSDKLRQQQQQEEEEEEGKGKESRTTIVDAGAAEDKGSRHTMEDASVVLPEAGLDRPGKLRCSHYAIYDGHGGRLAADYAQRHLHESVLAAGLPRESMDIKAAKKAILEGFRKTDESLLQESTKGNWLDGATAVCAWVLGQAVLVANIGDAKAVLARSSIAEGSNGLSDSQLKAIVVTKEHKAIYPQERARIQKAGGSVGTNGRLQGRLEVSRAFGDRQFKKVGVIATPDIHSFEITEREHFMILGCDGLWGVFGPSDAVNFVQKQLKETPSATVAARCLVKEAVRERLCKDNCTAIVIVFRHN